MNLEIQIAIALVLDFVIGDPPQYPHPVRLIGKLAHRVETIFRYMLGSTRTAGILTVIFVLAATGGSGMGILWVANHVHSVAGDAVACLLIYVCISARDLSVHAFRVESHLENGNVEEARQSLSMIVGRKTSALSKEDVSRAAVESVAENLVDGVTAPLFFALLGGPVAALVFKAASTLDSMFGYRNERYEKFGWASARLDDLLNLLPARLTAPIICIALLPNWARCATSWRTCLQDGSKHASPNSGIPEAAFAGALGISLGGPTEYSFGTVDKPFMGDAAETPGFTHIRKARGLMYRTTILFAALGISLRAAVQYLGG